MMHDLCSITQWTSTALFIVDKQKVDGFKVARIPFHNFLELQSTPLFSRSSVNTSVDPLVLLVEINKARMWILKWNLYSTSDKILAVKCILVDPWTTQFTIIHAFHILNKPRFLEFLKIQNFHCKYCWLEKSNGSLLC